MVDGKNIFFVGWWKAIWWLTVNPIETLIHPRIIQDICYLYFFFKYILSSLRKQVLIHGATAGFPTIC